MLLWSINMGDYSWLYRLDMKQAIPTNTTPFPRSAGWEMNTRPKYRDALRLGSKSTYCLWQNMHAGSR